MLKVCQHGWRVWGGVTRRVPWRLKGRSVYLVASKAVSTPPESLPIICICLCICLYNPVASKAAINPSPNSSLVPSTPPSKLVSIHSHQIVRRDSLNPQLLILTTQRLTWNYNCWSFWCLAIFNFRGCMGRSVSFQFCIQFVSRHKPISILATTENPMRKNKGHLLLIKCIDMDRNISWTHF